VEGIDMKLYLVTALVKKNGTLGCRANIGAHNSKEEAVGSLTTKIIEENYEVLNIDGVETDFSAGDDYTDIISQLRWFGEKKKWPKGLEGMPVLLKGTADILQGYSLK
jgi:hypothetical protein